MLLLMLCTLSSILASDYMLEMANEENVMIERHYVTTEDGYILLLYYLPAPIKEDKSGNKLKPLLFMHGLLCSSPVYITYPGKSAGYYFHKRGYPVYMGNFRGNTFSRNHTTFDPDELEFWNFSWHEMGLYDLPAMIDFILSHSGQDKLIYVGHSQGATSAFVMLSERPSYGELISLAHLMTPPAIFRTIYPYAPAFVKQNMKNILNILEKFAIRSRNYEILRYNNSVQFFQFIGELCIILPNIFCKTILHIVFGPVSSGSYSNRILLDGTKSIPAGAGYLQLLHYGQLLANSGRFEKFDFGADENVKVYGTIKPPEYNFSKIQTKIHVMYGTNDYVVPPENIPELLQKIQHAVVAVSKFNFNHADFVIGRLVKDVQNFWSVHSKVQQQKKNSADFLNNFSPF